MAFNWKAFATGFMEQSAKEITKASDRVEEYVKADYVTKLEEAKKLREEKREQKKNARKAIGVLKSMGISDETAIANLVDQNGYDTVISIADRLKELQMGGKLDIDPETFLTGIKDADLTIEDAFKRLDGELKYIEAGVPVRADGEKTFWEDVFGMDYAESASGELERAFGESYDTLASEVKGEYTYDPVRGGITIDWAQLKDKADLDNLSPSEVRGVHTDIMTMIRGPLELEVSWDPDAQDYVGRDVKTQKFLDASSIADRGAEYYNILYGRYKGDAARARKETMEFIRSQVTAPAPAPAPPPPPPATTTQSTITSASAQQQAGDAQTYAQEYVQRVGLDSLNPTDKQNAIATLSKDLRGLYNLNTAQINQIIQGL